MWSLGGKVGVLCIRNNSENDERKNGTEINGDSQITLAAGQQYITVCGETVHVLHILLYLAINVFVV